MLQLTDQPIPINNYYIPIAIDTTVLIYKSVACMVVNCMHQHKWYGSMLNKYNYNDDNYIMQYD